MKNISFTWDFQKNSENIDKYRISFEKARSVFFDDNARLIRDPDHPEEIEKFLILGISESLNLPVVCRCIREKDEIIRILSARKATKNEQMQYKEF